jgi:hypothetical protein
MKKKSFCDKAVNGRLILEQILGRRFLYTVRFLWDVDGGEVLTFAVRPTDLTQISFGCWFYFRLQVTGWHYIDRYW